MSWHWTGSEYRLNGYGEAREQREKRCAKCYYRTEDKGAGIVCAYIRFTGHPRGCPPESEEHRCERFLSEEEGCKKYGMTRQELSRDIIKRRIYRGYGGKKHPSGAGSRKEDVE